MLAKLSPLSQTLQDSPIASPSKLKTKYALYRKNSGSFLPIQTPPLSVTTSNTNFGFTRTKKTSLMVQHMPHPYAQPSYDFPVSPREQSSNYSDTSPISKYFSPLSPSAAASPRSSNHIRRISPFFSSVSVNSPSTKRAVPKIIPGGTAHKFTAEHAHGTTYEFTSPLESEPCTASAASQTLSVHDKCGLGITEELEKPKQRKRPSLLFSIPEEDCMQSRSSKSFKRLSNANSTQTWRNSWNTTCGDVGIAITTVSTPVRSGGLSEDGLSSLGCDDGEEGSRACLMGLLEELEEWGCEWIDNTDPPR